MVSSRCFAVANLGKVNERLLLMLYVLIRRPC